ncbi:MULTISPECIES: HAD hydrolase family protein [Streptomyces]|uniref:Hydroxymethylpyrimidine pyrophosphatase-like HAD family hydrolase n=1 Tax=Streptomyces murinus TaxID=33900 RepID=A0A7W3RL12_STRMR|nr:MULTISPECIES: HAD family hydrolase [Streptomyces]MBA9053652.1 hydroxymethylpyrimidine pyrophosphatase-like HAD family hydrolase [Streptomyces murinus]WUD07200.1 Cof-type HAD-IIB family hydrolase [Streptomyces murinus]
MITSSARTTVFDVDGTLCFDGRTIDGRIRTAIETCERAGHQLVFASARPVRDLLPVLGGAFPTATLIGGNGSLVSVGGEVRARAAFEAGDLGKLLIEADRFRAGYLADGPWDYAYTGPAEHPILGRVDQGRLARRVDLAGLPAVVKFLVVDATDMAALAEAGRVLGMTVNHHLDEAIIDFAPGTTNKWEALASLGIDRYNAFGNDINDLDLLRHAHHSVRVGGHPALDGIARVTVAADPEAVATEISRLAAV